MARRHSRPQRPPAALSAAWTPADVCQWPASWPHSAGRIPHAQPQPARPSAAHPSDGEPQFTALEIRQASLSLARRGRTSFWMQKVRTHGGLASCTTSGYMQTEAHRPAHCFLWAFSGAIEVSLHITCLGWESYSLNHALFKTWWIHWNGNEPAQASPWMRALLQAYAAPAPGYGPPPGLNARAPPFRPAASAYPPPAYRPPPNGYPQGQQPFPQRPHQPGWGQQVYQQAQPYGYVPPQGAQPAFAAQSNYATRAPPQMNGRHPQNHAC